MKPLPELPREMRTLERDARGYPIPYIVMRDRMGRPHFTVNNNERVQLCIRRKVCGICGKRLRSGYWFVGGVRCFTEPNGAFLDPPMHFSCAQFALKVCPYLALSNYSKRIDDRTIKEGDMPDDTAIVANQDMPDTRPEVFCLGRTDDYRVINDMPGSTIMIVTAWNHVEAWRHGEKIYE